MCSIRIAAAGADCGGILSIRSLRHVMDGAEREHVRAGVALFNAGHHLAAHEPWEEAWLEGPRGERDDCLQGLVQAAGAIHHANDGNPAGAVGLAESATDYLTACDPGTIPVSELRSWLSRLADDPDLPERDPPPSLSVDGERVRLSDLQFPAAGIAAEALAETHEDEILEAAVEYAEADLEADRPTSPFVRLVLDYLADGGPIVRERLEQHVRRRRSRDEDVSGLFE